MYFGGIDIGSTMTKVALVDQAGAMVSALKGASGAEHRRLAHDVMRRALDQGGLRLEEVAYVVATGYGRVNVPFAERQVTELSCHARGVWSLFPEARTAIDIGGQDAKCMKLRGPRLVDFAMNDKCAAGTGRFLEMVSATLDIGLDEMSALARRARRKVRMSGLCTIFVQQDIVAALSAGEAVEDVLAGVNEALAGRVAALARRCRVEPEVVLTGGVARNAGIVAAMKEALACEIRVPPDPLMTGALGAALLAREYAAQEGATGAPVPGRVRQLRETRFFE